MRSQAVPPTLDILSRKGKKTIEVLKTSDNGQIRPQKHPMEPGQEYNERHHEQHYHVETKRNPEKGWKSENAEIYKPEDYTPGMGTGFKPGETYPGMI